MTNNTHPAAAERSPRRRWPLVLLAAPAAVAIWSGWVGLGQMAGFGVVHPLPGIADGWTLNSAITLPVGVEAYSAYALGTWLSDRPIPATARRFAAWSALGALALGLLGQVAYHLLTALGYRSAPIVVVVFVACLPVLVLGAGAALHHLLDNPAIPIKPAGVTTEPGALIKAAPGAPSTAPAATPARPTAGARRVPIRRGVPGTARRRLLADYLADARAQLTPEVDPTPAWCRRVTGCSAGTSVKLAAALRAPSHPIPDPPATVDEATGHSTSTNPGDPNDRAA